MEKTALSWSYIQIMQLTISLLKSGRLISCAILLFARPSVGQTVQFEKLQSKIAKVEQELQPKLGAVRLHRMEELEDDLFRPKLGSTNIESPFFAYVVEQRRYFVEGGEIHQNIPAGKFSIYIAISTDGEHAYGLAGFPAAEDNFGRLVSDFHILAPQNSDDAQTRALFCARVVYGAEPQQWVFSESQAQMRVLSSWPDHNTDAHSQATRWWQDYRRAHPHSDLSLKTTSKGNGIFLTRLPTFWAPVESNLKPELRELRILVNKEGACQLAAPAGGEPLTR
jgi:hypothetical protein